MPLKRLSLIPILFLIAILSPAIMSPRSLCAETIRFQVDLLDGRNVVGELIASEQPVPNEEKTALLKLKTPKGTESWPIDQVLRLTQTESASIGSPPTKKSSKAVWVELVDGSRIQVDDLSITETGARLDRRPAPLEIPIRDLHAVRFREASGSIFNQWRGLTTKPSDNGDRLVVLKSDALSVHHGSLGPIDAARVELTVGERTLRVRREKVFGLIYAHPAGRPLAETVCRLTETNGSTWSVASWTIGKGKIKLTLPCEATATLPWESIQTIDFSRGKIVYLSDLEPTSVRWKPYFSNANSETDKSAAAWFAPKRDRTILGGPIRVGDKTFDKGLSVHSRTELSYNLTDRFRRLKGTAALDNRAGPGGHVRLVLRSGDRVLLDRPIAAGAAPVPINVDLTGVTELTILVDYGENLDISDHLNLAEIRLIK